MSAITCGEVLVDDRTQGYRDVDQMLSIISSGHSRRIAFSDFLRAATGVVEPIDLDAHAQIVVMPANGDGKPTRRKSAAFMATHATHLVEYTTQGGGYGFRRAVGGRGQG